MADFDFLFFFGHGVAGAAGVFVCSNDLTTVEWFHTIPIPILVVGFLFFEFWFLVAEQKRHCARAPSKTRATTDRTVALLD